MLMRTLVALAFTATVNAAAHAFEEPDTYRHGATYRTAAVTAAGECGALCANDARCQAWSMIRAGLRGDGAVCELKSAIPPASPSPCCVSGVAPHIEALNEAPLSGPGPHADFAALYQASAPDGGPFEGAIVRGRRLDQGGDNAGLAGGRSPRR